MTKARRLGGAIIALAAAAGVAVPAVRSADGGAAHFADADDRALVLLGKALYRTQCAGCHGRYLQGQALWQLDDAYAGRRAPAFDETGFVWQRSDEDLFRITKLGDPSGKTPGAMPAFEQRLDDREILAIIAFIKARWPIALRILQAMHNPGLAGMPKGADAADWQLPANCNAVLRRAEAAASQPSRAD
jgi:S-disulfanyl-L-cysteine oxidoreductase SoxD